MIPLKQVRVENPCAADWEQMAGTEKVRFCAGCCKNVHNLSAMTRAEAAQTLAQPEGLPCVRFHHDAVGAPLTREALPARRRFLGVLAGALLALAGGWSSPRSASGDAPGRHGPSQPLPPATAGAPVVLEEMARPRPLMGKIVMPHRASSPTPPKHHGKGKRRKD